MDFVKDERFAFMFAHPDDDVLICGTMRLLMEGGADVHGIWVTSADFFGQGALRERELAKAMSILGLPQSHMHLLKIPDMAVARELDRAADSVATTLALIKPGKVFANAFEGGHPDHDSVNFLAYEGSYRAGLTPEIFEFPLYNGSGPFYTWKWRINDFPPGDLPVLYNPLTDDAVRRKYRVMRAYSSQWMYMGPARMASPKRRLKKLGEPYRRCPEDRDHTVRPHAGELNYERWFCRWMKVSFNDFSSAVLTASQARRKLRK